MGYQPIEDLLPKAGNSVYKLIRMAAKRAIELAEGRPKLVEGHSLSKTATVALEEIRQGKVVLGEVAGEFEPSEITVKKEEKDIEPELSVS